MSTDTESDAAKRFVALIIGYLDTLPYDLRVLHEAVSSPDLDRPARELAAATVMHALTPNVAVADERPGLAFIDDTILLRVALRRIRDAGGEGAPSFVARFPEYFDVLDNELALVEEALGHELFAWLIGKLGGLAKLQFKGKRASQYVDDEEAIALLYEEGLTFQTHYELTEQSLEGRLRRAAPIIESLERRRSDEAKRLS